MTNLVCLLGDEQVPAASVQGVPQLGPQVFQLLDQPVEFRRILVALSHQLAPVLADGHDAGLVVVHLRGNTTDPFGRRPPLRAGAKEIEQYLLKCNLFFLRVATTRIQSKLIC